MSFPNAVIVIAIAASPKVEPLPAGELAKFERELEGKRPIASQSFRIDGKQRCLFVAAEKNGAFKALYRCAAAEPPDVEVRAKLLPGETFLRVDSVSFIDLDGDENGDLTLLLKVRSAEGKERQALTVAFGDSDGSMRPARE